MYTTNPRMLQNINFDWQNWTQVECSGWFYNFSISPIRDPNSSYRV